MCRGKFAGVPRVLSKCFLLLQIFCQNRENAAISGHGERIKDHFFGNQHHMGLHHSIFGDRDPEKWLSPKKLKNVITILAVACDATRHQLE